LIINLWSTPRTGSVWYSYHLQKQLSPCILLSEPFNRYHMNLYHRIENDTIKNYHEYIPGSFYKNYIWEDQKILTKRTFQPRTRNAEEEETYIISLLEKIDDHSNYIIHSHVSPMCPTVLDKLMAIGKNIFIYRKDKLAQLASYAIAYETKEFVRFTKKEGIEKKVRIQDLEPIKNLIKRIKVWESLPKENIIAYEDIKFYEQNGMPIKQNIDYSKILDNESIYQIKIILEKEYYN